MKWFSFVLSLLILTSPLYAQQAILSLNVFSMSGGLNTEDAPTHLEQNEATDLQNIDFTRRGSFEKRKGYTQLNTTAIPGTPDQITGLFQARFKANDFFVATAGAEIRKMEALDGTWDDITGGVTITQDLLFDFEMRRDTLIAVNGTDPAIKWTGSGNVAALTLPTDVTKVKWVSQFIDHTFICNVTVGGIAQPSRCYFSNVSTTETWTDTDFFDVYPDDGDVEITGVAQLGARLLIFKTRHIYSILFTGNAKIPFVIQQTPAQTGTISGHSIQNVNNNLVYLAYDGIYLFNGADSTRISRRITPTLKDFTEAQFKNATSMNYRPLSQYWITMATTGTTNDRILIWDYANNAWLIHAGILANVLTVYIDTNDLERPYHGDYLGLVYRNDDGKFDDPSGTDTAIDAFWKSKWFDFDEPAFNKVTQFVYLYTGVDDGTTVNFAYAFDFEEGDFVTEAIDISPGGGKWDTAVWDTGEWGSNEGLISRIDILGQGKTMRININEDTLNDIFRVDGFSILYKPGTRL